MLANARGREPLTPVLSTFRLFSNVLGRHQVTIRLNGLQEPLQSRIYSVGATRTEHTPLKLLLNETDKKATIKSKVPSWNVAMHTFDGITKLHSNSTV